MEGKIEVTLRILPIEEDDVEEKDEIELILNINDKEKMSTILLYMFRKIIIFRRSII